MKRIIFTLTAAVVCSLCAAQTRGDAVNDNNTPLHLMKPAYRIGYGVSKPDDVKAVVPAVLQHRLVLTAEAEMEGYTPQKVARRLLDKVEVPK